MHAILKEKNDVSFTLTSLNMGNNVNFNVGRNTFQWSFNFSTKAQRFCMEHNFFYFFIQDSSQHLSRVYSICQKTIFYLNFSVPFNFLFEKQKLRGNKEKDNSTRCLIFFTKASYTANTLV